MTWPFGEATGPLEIKRTDRGELSVEALLLFSCGQGGPGQEHSES